MMTVVRVCVVVVGALWVFSYTSSHFPSWRATHPQAYSALPLGVVPGMK